MMNNKGRDGMEIMVLDVWIKMVCDVQHQMNE